VLVAVVLVGTEVLAASILPVPTMLLTEVVPVAAQAVVPASVLDFLFLGFFPFATPVFVAVAAPKVVPVVVIVECTLVVPACAGAVLLGCPACAEVVGCAKVVGCADCAALLSYKR